MNKRMRRRVGMLWSLNLAMACVASAQVDGPAPPDQKAPPSGRVESIARPDGGTTPGKVVGDLRSGFRFEPTGGGPTVPLEAAGVVTFEGAPSDPLTGFPPIRVEFGLDQRISGRLGRADEGSIQLIDGPGGSPVQIDRAGATALEQRPGEAMVVRDGWESLDHWATIGEPELVENPHLEGSRALGLPARGGSVTYTLASPIGSGRLEVAFHDPGGLAPGHQWFVDLLFRGTTGPETVRVILDAGNESLGIQTTGGSALAVQHLARKPGWHRLRIRFGPETELAVDGDELAHGRAPGGPLVEVRLAHQPSPNGPEPLQECAMMVCFDDFRLVRLAEPVGNLEVATQVDDVRFVDGDQIFGRFRSADADLVRLGVEDRDIPLTWTEVASIQFRRDPRPGRPIDGLLVRVEWRSGPWTDIRNPDQIEGALLAVSDTGLTVATSFAGDLTIPRDRLTRLKVLGRGVRLVVDPFAHHLGDDISVPPHLLDPPLREGGTLERTFTLDTVPDPSKSAASAVLDVIQVIGEEAGDAQLAALVRKGQLRTVVWINGVAIDYLNRHITSMNMTPERIRVPIPPKLLHAGRNTIRFEQGGQLDSPDELDDLGILTIAIEFAPTAR